MQRNLSYFRRMVRMTIQSSKHVYLEPEGLEELELIRFYPSPLRTDRHEYPCICWIAPLSSRTKRFETAR